MLNLLTFFILGFTQRAAAYPEFIGYKYTSCLTCHYNGHGNGPLNDYGRAVWASEISGRLFAGRSTDERLGEASGFLGPVKMPFWLKPGIKTRYLMLRNNPPNSNDKTRWIVMQADFTLATFFDREERFGFIGSVGYVPEPQRLQLQANGRDVENVISREHYLRKAVGENWWFYAGMMDKVYGLRIVDHTAYSRSKTGLAQNDQAHGVIGQYVREKYEISFNLFAGNLYQDADLRQKGVSVMFEHDIREAWRAGVSALHSSNDYVRLTRAGIQNRFGMGYGSAILLDTGWIKNAPKAGDSKNGYYLYSEAMQRVIRGYHLFLSAQAFKDDMTSNRPDNFTTGVGLLMFPLQRAELRLEWRDQSKFTDNNEVQKDSWTLLTQLHVSL